MAKMPEAPLTPEQQQARNKENAALLGKIAEYAPFIPNFKSNNAEVKPAAESQAQTSQATQPEAKPAAPTSTSNLASLDTAPAFKPVEAKTIAAPSFVPKMNAMIPNQIEGVKGDVYKSQDANGKVTYSDNPYGIAAKTTQNQAVNASAQPQGYLTMPQQQPRLSQEQIRQIYREDPTIAMGMQNATGIDENGNRLENNPQNRAAEQSRLLTLNPTQQQDPNAYRNSLIAQLNKFGNLGDKARRESAAIQLKMLGDKEQNKENNLAKQQIADQENALKSSYYQSEALKNEAQARAALTPSQPKQDIQKGDDGNFYSVENGQLNVIPKSPQTLLNEQLQTRLAKGEISQEDYLKMIQKVNE